MKKYRSKLIALGTALAASLTVASPILFAASCAKNEVVNDNNTNDSTDDNTGNDTNNGTGDNTSNDSTNKDDSSSDDSNSSNGGNNSGSSDSTDSNTGNNNNNSSNSGSNSDSSNSSGSNTGNNNNNNSSNSGSSSDSSNSSGSNSSNSGSNSSNDSSTNNSGSSSNTTTVNKNFIYDKTNKTATVTAASVGLSTDIFDAFETLFDSTTKSSETTKLTNTLVSMSNGYIKSTDAIDFTNYKLNLSNISSNDWTLELPVTSSTNSLVTSVYITFANNYSKISELLDSNSIVVNSGDYFPYANLTSIKSLSPSNIVKILKSPSTGNATGISTNFSFVALDGSKSIASDNVMSFDYSDSNGRSVKYLINYNGKLGLLTIKNTNTTLPTTSLISSTFGTTTKKGNLGLFTSQTNNFSELKFTTVAGSTNDSLVLGYTEAEKSSTLSSLLKNYLAFNGTSMDYEAGFGLDLAHYFSSYFGELKTKWVSDDLISNENISFYNTLQPSTYNAEAGNSGGSNSNNGGFGIMTEPGMPDNSFGLMSLSTNANLQSSTTSSTVTKLNGAIGFELRNPTSEVVSFNLPINNETYSLSPNSIATVVIKFTDSIVKPRLIENSSSSNTAYLSAGFTNVKMQVSQTTFTTDTLAGTVSYTDSNTKTYDFSSTAANITPDSYALKTKVSGVSAGNTALTDLAAVASAYNTSNLETSLKEATAKQLDDSFNKSIEAVGAVQNIMLKMADNPTVYSFLQNISSEVEDLFTFFTSDKYLPSIIGGLFSSDSVSTYLANNIGNIAEFLNANNTSNSSLVSTVVDLLRLIVESNPTQQNFKDLLAQLDTYLPLLSSYLPTDAQFLLPLIQKIVPYLSKDDSIINIVFENLDYILDFAIEQANNIFINSSVVNVLTSLKSYLLNLLLYSKYYGAANSVNKYKQVKVFSVVTNELFGADASKSLLTLISSALALSPNSTSNISDVLNSITSLLNNNIKFKKQIEDYSNLTFNNSGSAWNALKWEWKYTGTPTRVLIATQLGKIFESLVKVKVDGQTSDLYTALKTNVKKEVVADDFTYSSTNKTVNQNYTVKYSFIKTVTIDTMPICVLLNNMEDTTNLGLTSAQASQINMGVNVYLSRFVMGRYIPHSQGAGFNITNGKGLGWLFPTDIVISSKNYVTLNYSATNAKVYPTVDKYTGAINFSWNTTRNVGIEASNVWKDSNSAFKSKKVANQSWYGSAFGFLTQDLNALATLFGIQFTKLPFRYVIGGLIKFDGGFTNYTTVTTNLSNPTKISNYNANIANTDYTVTQLKSGDDIKAFLKNIVNTYGTWTTSSTTNKPEFSVKLPSDFATQLAKYFNISSNFTSEVANYSYGFSGMYYTLPLDGNINSVKPTYQYTFTLKFSIPTVFTTYETTDTPSTTKLVKSISFSFNVKS